GPAPERVQVGGAGRRAAPRRPARSEADLAPPLGVAADKRLNQRERGRLVVEREPPAAPLDTAAVRLDVPAVAVLPEVDVSPGRVGEPAVPPVSTSVHPSIRTYVRTAVGAGHVPGPHDFPGSA